MSPAPDISAGLTPLQRLLTAPPWRKGQVRQGGTLLARGRRTVTAALRQMGLSNAPAFSLYPHGLNRARWSTRDGSRRVVVLLVRTVVAGGGTLTFVIDETVERRWGRCIRQRGQCRDPLASSKQRSVATSGLRGIVLPRVLTPPWTSRAWALPVCRVPAPTPEVSQRLGLRHKTVAQRARQMIWLVRRWLPTVERAVVGAHADSVLALGTACTRRRIRLLAPLRLDAALYDPAPLRAPGTTGRPRVQGTRLPTLAQVLTDAQTSWQRIRVRWDDGRWRLREVTSAPAVWSRIGPPVLPLRGGIVRDPQGRCAPRAYFATWRSDLARAIGAACSTRWTSETPCEERHAHLGVATQRQWSDHAIERPTPCLFGLYSIGTLLAHAL